MKKLFLTLLLISPLAKSEMLELTCEGNFSYFIKYDTEKDIGEVKYLTNFKDVDNLPAILLRRGNVTNINKLTITEDYYDFYIRRYVGQPQNITINRKNLTSVFHVTAGQSWLGQCVLGELGLTKNII
jgi:hypothetical protein